MKQKQHYGQLVAVYFGSCSSGDILVSLTIFSSFKGLLWVQKQCHVADFETYVLIFVHCASKSASSTLFYHPRCKNRKPKICFLFFCFKWGKNSIMGNLLPRTLGLRGGMQAIGFRLARLQILCYDCFMFNLKDKFYVCGD